MFVHVTFLATARKFIRDLRLVSITFICFPILFKRLWLIFRRIYGQAGLIINLLTMFKIDYLQIRFVQNILRLQRPKYVFSEIGNEEKSLLKYMFRKTVNG